MRGRLHGVAALAVAAVVAGACAPRISDDEASRILAGSRDAATAANEAAGEATPGPAGLAAGEAGGVSEGEIGGATAGEAEGVTAGEAGSVASAGTASDPTAETAAGDSAASGQPTAAGPSDPGVTDTEIRIGVTGPFSGFAAFLGDEVLGSITSYFAMKNAQGGVHGRKLRLISYDNRLDPSQELANLRKLWEQDKVIAVFQLVGDYGADYITRNRIPTLVFGVTAPSFQSKYPTIFPLVGNSLLWTQEFVHGLRTLGVAKPGMRVAMLYSTALLDVRPYLPYFKEAWEKIGATIVSEDAVELGADCTGVVLRMRQLDIDWWDFQGLGFASCLSAAYRQGYKPNIGWGEWPTSVAGLTELVGPAIDGVWGGSQGDKPDGRPRQKTAAHDEYVDAITRYYPSIATEGHFESPGTIGYWTGAKLLVAALEAQGRTVKREGVIGWISNVENWDPGITPPIVSMKPDCKTGSEAVWIAQWHYADGVATRSPATGYFTTPFKDEYGGKCFLTRLSDEVVK